MTDALSTQVIGDPFYQLVPYAEPLEEDDHIAFTEFLFINIFVKFTRILFYDDHDYNNKHNNRENQFGHESRDYVTYTHTLPLSFHVLNDNNADARMQIDRLLALVYVPSSLTFLTGEIIKCGRETCRDPYGLNDRFKLNLNVEVGVLVDELPCHILPVPSDYEDEDLTMMDVDIPFVGASKSSIESLKRVRIDDQAGVSCSVCLDDILVGSQATKLPCSHIFHGDCIVKWLVNSKYCPLCRFAMPSN